MRIEVAPRGLGEPAVEVGNEVRRKRVGRLARADAAQPQFLDQPVLQGQVGALHAALGLAGVGAHDVDVQLVQGPAELRDATLAELRLGHRPEDARLVAVERHRLAVRLQVAAGCLEVGKARFGGHEAQLHQPAGGVVDEHQQGARWRSLLEPGVITAIDLDELAQAVAAVARLVDLGGALPAWYPQACRHHQRPHSLLAEDDPMAFLQLLGGQGRTKVGVALANDRDGTTGNTRGQLVIAGTPAPA